MSKYSPRAVARQWLAGPLPPDVSVSLDRLARADDVQYIAVMPDVHLSHDVCTGIVLATKRVLYPSAVGNDIGCGMAAIRFQCDAGILADEASAARLLGGLCRTVPTIRHSRLTLKDELPEALQLARLSHPRLEKLKTRDGRVEFATLGRGNHFIEFQADDEGCLWLMVHSGSRAIGQAITAHHVGHARPSTTSLAYLDADSEAGRAYLDDVHWACRYANESRREMMQAVAGLVADLFGVQADTDSIVCCEHNHVRREVHFGEELWVHRKGAISAREGEPGIIPGSMGTPSYHVEGRGAAEAFCSSSHGAGRCKSRSEAFKTISTDEFYRQMKHVWFDHRMAGKLRDEAPSAYKDIHAVMRAQRALTRILRRLRPMLSYKGA
jgi:tRNA-splicing ligase RtcB (3'-phosphate/5'-hydroxy nucleic acid ligase)